jgi:quercetin dioxygenase-like cupin family protein
MLFKTDQLWSEIACYEPGQSTPMHTHPKEEEAGAIVKFPATVPHDVRNLGRERCVIMFLKVNPKVLKG